MVFDLPFFDSSGTKQFLTRCLGRISKIKRGSNRPGRSKEIVSKPQKIVMARLGVATHLKFLLGCHCRQTSLAMTILMKRRF
jgi:hypothetical protein